MLGLYVGPLVIAAVAYWVGYRRGRASVPPQVDIATGGMTAKSYSLRPGDSLVIEGHGIAGVPTKLTVIRVGVTEAPPPDPERGPRIDRWIWGA